MLAPLCLLTIHAAGAKPMSRAAFSQAMGAVKSGWTPDQVRQTLGRPDDVWPVNDSKLFLTPGETWWCYGSKGHHSLPTLGSVSFQNGKVIGWRYSNAPPSQELIGDAELTDSLHALDLDARDSDWCPNPAAEIRMANLLISKGKPKAIAILREFERLSLPTSVGSSLAVAFTSPFDRPPPQDAPGAPYDVGIMPLVEFHVRNKEFLIQGVPIDLCIFHDDWSGVMTANYADPTPVGHYLDKHEADLTIRTQKIVPPADPFVIYPEAAALEAPLTYQDPHNPAHISPNFNSERTPVYVLAQILEMVSTVYRPFGDDEIHRDLNPSDFERYHKEFLALHCHWDLSRQMYVRKDGSFFNDPPDNSVRHQFQFTNIPELDLSGTFGRTRHNQVGLSLTTTELGAAKMGDAILSFQDTSTGTEVGWVIVNDQLFPVRQKAEYLALPTHLPTRKGGRVSSGFLLKRGDRLRLKLEIDGKSYLSPVFRP